MEVEAEVTQVMLVDQLFPLHRREGEKARTFEVGVFFRT